MPLFSIVTVTLNPPQEDLWRTLESVVEQEFGNWELIVKDGGSREGALDGVPEDERIRVVTEEDSGIFDAMNQSLNHVRGRFICFLNAGDVFVDSKVLCTVAAASHAHEDTQFLYGDVAKPYSRSGFELYPSRLSRFYLFKHMVCHQAWFVGADYCRKVNGYETDFPSGSDYRFLLKMVLRDNIRCWHVPNVLVCYKGDGFSARDDVRREADLWIDEVKRELYGEFEYQWFALAWRTRDLMKQAVYDRFLYKIWRNIQLWRTSR